MFLRGTSDDIRVLITLAIPEFAIFAGVQFLLYAAEGVAPDYYVRSMRLDVVEGGMSFRLPTVLVNVLIYFGFYRIAEKMRMDSVLVSLAFYCVTEIDWSSSGSSDDFLSYDSAKNIMHDYPAERIAPVKRQKIDDDPVVPVLAPTVDVI